ncbi:MAG: CHAT domain-containing tetratricopeptide repeat protein, partial [Acidobacteriota bacterium]
VLVLETGYRRLEGPLTNSLAQLSSRVGDWQKAIEAYDRALELCRRAGNRAGELSALNRLASAYERWGDFQKALKYFEDYLAIVRIEGDHKLEAFLLKDVGRMHHALGDRRKAADHFERAVAIMRDVGDRASEAWLLLLIGNHFLLTTRDYENALNYYNESQLIYQGEKDRAHQAAVLNNIAQTYLNMRDKQRAMENFEHVLALWRAIGNRPHEAATLNNMGMAYYDFGELQKALVLGEQALNLHRELGSRKGVMGSLQDMACIYAALGDIQRATALNEELLTFWRTIGNKEQEARTLRRLALLERDRGNLTEARRYLESALQIVESTRASFTSPDLRSRYFVSAKGYYELYVDLLMQLHQQHPMDGFDAAALQASEKARARSLLDLLVEAHANIRRGASPQLIERERALQRRINDKAQEQGQLLSGKHTSEQADTVASEIRTLLTTYQELDTKIRIANPAYASLTRPSSLSLSEIQQQVLNPDTILLEYFMGNERSYLWLVTPDSISSYMLPKRAEIGAAARSVRDLLIARQPVPSETNNQYRARVAAADAQYNKAAAALSEILFGQIVSQLGKKRLLIMADGALQYIPLGALPAPGGDRPLILDHEIVNLPSASVLAVLRRDTAERAPAARAIAVLADPVFDKNDMRIKGYRTRTLKGSERSLAIDLQRALRGFDLVRDEGTISRLPFTRKEADAIFATAPPGAGMKAVDFNANRELATSAELSRYRIVHFATHALLNGEHPELSGIVLSLVDEHGRSRDGFLRLHDIYNLNLPAEMVVLSACKTGLGKEITGEGLIGLTRGFMYAGAKRIIASLWKVDDWATAELMKRFYKKMLVEKLSPAAALRAAQIEMLRQPKWRAPYYWAAFTLQGEPN